MCKIGDIIVVDKYIGDDGVEVGRHSFVVLSIEKGKIGSMDYDLVANAMSSIKNETHREKIKKNKGNLLINLDNECVSNSNHKDGFIKAWCLTYFKKEKINYYTLGSLSVETWEALEDLLEELNESDGIVSNYNNL